MPSCSHDVSLQPAYAKSVREICLPYLLYMLPFPVLLTLQQCLGEEASILQHSMLQCSRHKL
jgi:hypothetical protein